MCLHTLPSPLIQPCSNSLHPQLRTGRPQVGDLVKLTKHYLSVRGDASSGPLRPGDIGTMIVDDGSSNPFRVRSKNGVEHWYEEGTIELAGCPQCNVISPSLANVTEATITLELISEPQHGHADMYVGLTAGRHDIAGGKPAAGAAGTSMFRWLDGCKLAATGWVPHAQRAVGSSSALYRGSYPACKIIILKYVRASSQDESACCKAPVDSQAAGSLTVYDLDDGGSMRMCGTGPVALGIPDQEYWFCCDTFAEGQGVTILSMELDGVEFVGDAPPSSYLTQSVTVQREAIASTSA